MTRSLTGWMIFQILVGIWLFISPYILGFRDTMNASVNSMILGAVVVFIGLGMSIFGKSVCGVEQHVLGKTS